MTTRDVQPTEQTVRLAAGGVTLEGTLTVPDGADGMVLFAHGSGSSRHSPRNRFVAGELQDGGLATLLIDLLTADEEAVDRRTRHLRFDIGLLAERLVGATDWLARQPQTRDLRVGYFGSSTGGGAALVAAAWRPEAVAAVVSRGGRPDLAGDALPHVTAPTLLIVGGDDVPVIGMNREAMAQMTACAEKRLEIVPGATHLFEEPGKLEEVAGLAREWFVIHLSRREQPLVPFRNRREAGQALAASLAGYAHRPDVLVLALPRGGVPVAYEVAKALDAPLDVFLVRKLGLPGQEELAMGAIASGGIRVLNDDVVGTLRIPDRVIDVVAAHEQQELARRERAYRGDRPAPDVRGRTVILVDDGLATGSTMRAAATALRRQGPARLVIAVPVSSRDTCDELRDVADDIVCAATPEPFFGVGRWYEDFSQTTDEEVRDLLARSRQDRQDRQDQQGAVRRVA